ncbi:hypothetical protein [Shinella sp. M31]|uniref:hypothetical protein n=1 Tax=Shinella sp. M31 TaxID=3368615 RepID=UPI003B9DF069
MSDIIGDLLKVVFRPAGKRKDHAGFSALSAIVRYFGVETIEYIARRLCSSSVRWINQ